MHPSQMSRRCRQLVWVIMIGPLLSGCANVIPAFDIPNDIRNRPTVRSIVNRVQCELKAILDHNTLLGRELALYDDIQVGVELSLSVTDDGGLAPTFSALSGPLTFVSGFNLDQSRAQNFTEELQFSMRALRDEQPPCDHTPDTNLAGVLGLEEAYDLATHSGPFLNWTATGATGVFGGSVTFTVDKALTATGPTYTLKHFIGPGSLLTASDKNVDKLTFAFVRGKGAGQGPQTVMGRETQAVIGRIVENQIATALISIAQSQR